LQVSFFKVASSQSHIGFGNLGMTHIRTSVVDFATFLYVYEISLYTRKPRAIEPFLRTLEPIDPLGWLGFLLASLVVALFSITTLKCLYNEFSLQNAIVSIIKSCNRVDIVLIAKLKVYIKEYKTSIRKK
jgi:hypothetical protein